MKKSPKGKKRAVKKTAKKATKKAVKKKTAKKKVVKKKAAKKKSAKKKAAKKKTTKKKVATKKPAKKKPAKKKAATKKAAKKTVKKAVAKAAIPGKSPKTKEKPKTEKPVRVKGGYEVPPQVTNPKLTAAQIKELRIYLEGEKLRLIEEIANLTGQNFESIGGQRANRFANHLADVASDNQLVETLLVQSGMESDRLGFINEALDRIRIKKYGICERCGAHIGYPRLVAKPFARFCIVCREHLEKDAKRRF